MSTIISITLLGVLVLFLGALKQQRILLPVILAGLLIALGLTLRDWNTMHSYYNRMMVVDNQSIAFSAVLIFSTFLIFSFAAHYYRGVQRSLDDIYGVMIFALAGAVLMTSFGNLIMLFLGIETLSIALYVLAGSHKEAISSNEATLKYFLLGSFLSGFLLFGIALIYGSSGSFNLEDIHQFVKLHTAEGLPALFRAGLYLLIIGLAFKIAIVPFHFWAPDVYEGTPTLLTAFMATVVKTASIVALYRFFSVTFAGIHGEWETTLSILAALTIILGNLTGVYQPNLKRMLAYSSISHSGYMMLAVVAFSPSTSGSLLLYAVSYSLATILAFGILILIREVHGNDNFASFNGLSKTNPVEAFCLTIAMLSLTGIPPLAGFMAKYYLFVTAIEMKYLWLVMIAIGGSAVSVAYYFKPVIAMYLREPTEIKLNVDKPYQSHLIFITALIILVGLLPFLLIRIL
ncbi:MAG: NADH-quinone oxidoreductase subunit N [Bacteroidetes bacterium]|nr:NADH-quinone oxidoreductase subunit N [Bacteroidota bacterium]